MGSKLSFLPLILFFSFSSYTKDLITCPQGTFIVHYESPYSTETKQWCQSIESKKKHGPEVTILEGKIVKQFNYFDGKLVAKNKKQTIRSDEMVSDHVLGVFCIKSNQPNLVKCLNYQKLKNTHYLFNRVGKIVEIKFPEEVDQIIIQGQYNICALNYKKELRICHLPLIKKLKERLKKEDVPINQRGFYTYIEDWKEGGKTKRQVSKSYFDSIVSHEDDDEFDVYPLKSRNPISIRSGYLFQNNNSSIDIYARFQMHFYQQSLMRLIPRSMNQKFSGIKAQDGTIFCPNVNRYFECYQLSSEVAKKEKYLKTIGPINPEHAQVIENYLFWINDDFSFEVEKLTDTKLYRFEKFIRYLKKYEKIRALSFRSGRQCWMNMDFQIFCRVKIRSGPKKSEIQRFQYSAPYMLVEDKKRKEFIHANRNSSFSNGLCYREENKNEIKCFDERMKKGEHLVLPF